MTIITNKRKAEIKPYKIEIYNQIKAIIEKSGFILFANFKGLSVKDFMALREEVKNGNGNVKVIKNKIAKIVFSENLKEVSIPDEIFIDNTFIAYGNENVADIAKILKKYQKNKLIKLKGGIFENKFLNKEEVNSLADLPTKDQLIQMVVQVIAAPITNLVRDLNQIIAGLPQVISAIADKKENK